MEYGTCELWWADNTNKYIIHHWRAGAFRPIWHSPSFVSEEKISFIAVKFVHMWISTIYWGRISAKLHWPCSRHSDFNRTQVIWSYFIKLAFINVMQGFIEWFAAGMDREKEKAWLLRNQTLILCVQKFMKNLRSAPHKHTRTQTEPNISSLQLFRVAAI